MLFVVCATPARKHKLDNEFMPLTALSPSIVAAGNCLRVLGAPRIRISAALHLTTQTVACRADHLRVAIRAAKEQPVCSTAGPLELMGSVSSAQQLSASAVFMPHVPTTRQPPSKLLVKIEDSDFELPSQPLPTSAFSSPDQQRLQKQACQAPLQSQPAAKRHAYGTRPTSSARVTATASGKRDECVPRRTITNRQSAMRSKERHREYVLGLEQRVKHLDSELNRHKKDLNAIATNHFTLGDFFNPSAPQQ